MKKILLTLSAVVFAGVANAQFTGAPAQPAGGFEGPGVIQNAPNTVKSALAAGDDTPVTLRGQIINS